MLAHRRLSILDLSNAASQPMTDPGSGDTLVLNGEIYNYAELRSGLTAAGHSFQSSGDTAVMLRVLNTGGRSSVRTLRGMFAFGFWSSRERSLLIGRDPLGIKPLYLARNPDPRGSWSLAFASEVRALLASGLVTPKLNPNAAASVVWNGFMVAPETAVAGIESLLPGEYRAYDGRGTELGRQRYWTPATTGTPIAERDLAEELQRCVRLHLASDVPLGVFLSGGVDSSAVANLAQKAAVSRINTFTLSFEEAELSEGAIARQVAAAIGTEHRELVLTEGEFVARLDDALDCLDQPTFDALNSYYMSHAVREAGFKVALVGSGGDELFGGYASFRDLPKLLRADGALRFVPRGAKLALGRLLAGMLQPSGGEFPPQTRWAKLPDMLARGGDLLALYQLAYALFLPGAQSQLLGERGRQALVDGLPADTARRLSDDIRGREPLAAIGVLEQAMFLGERLLRDTDAASMASSIEIRLPLVDQVLTEQVDRLPSRERFDPVGKKAMLRKVGLKGLDPCLFDRPKAGFVLPYDRWLRSSLGSLVGGTLSDASLIRPTGLDPDAVGRLWRGFLQGGRGSTGRVCGRCTSTSAGAIGTASFSRRRPASPWRRNACSSACRR